MGSMRVVLAAALLLAAAPLAHADAAADKLFDEGLALSEHGQWEAACAKFTASIKLDPDASGTMLNLGRCHEKLGRIGTALAWYRKAEIVAEKHRLPAFQSAAAERAADLAPRVPDLRIVLAAPLPDGGRVAIDGTEIERADLAHVEVDPGHHVIDVTAPHKRPMRREIDVQERGELEITLDAFAPAELVDPGRGRRRTAFLVGGGGAVLLAGQAIAGFVGKEHVEGEAGAHTGWNHFAEYGLTSIGALGLVGIAAGAYLYLTAPPTYEADRATAWMPIASPDRVGIAYLGRF